jgi:glyoxylase-like metal-dependent hydrolase (beta-lactamase superfamily II)
MLVESRAVAPFFKNGFVLGCEETLEGAIVDPGDEVDELLAVISDRRLSAKHILLTHAHVDHVSGVARARAVLGVPVYLHPADLALYNAAVDQARFFGLSVEQPPPIDRSYADHPEIVFGRYTIRVHHTPGHSPGGVCLQVGRTRETSAASRLPASGPSGPGARSQEPGAAPPKLFVGDTLFAGSIGRTDLPGGDYQTLIRSIKEVLFPMGDQAEVYPGHGPKTTIGEERRTNPFLQ